MKKLSLFKKISICGIAVVKVVGMKQLLIPLFMSLILIYKATMPWKSALVNIFK